MSDDGEYVFFESLVALMLWCRRMSSTLDVYEWEGLVVDGSRYMGVDRCFC
jgi:hypothetical protein